MTSVEERERAVAAEPDKRAPLILIVCCVAQFMVILDLSIVNVALPLDPVGAADSRRPTCSGSSTRTRSSSPAS